MRVIKTAMFLMLSLGMMTGWGVAQPTLVPVPDIIGLTPPQAESILHLAGLRLGEQTIDLSPIRDIEQLGTISAQSVVAGEDLETGQSVDIVIVQAPNSRFFYDDNDLTFINQTGRTILLSPLEILGEGGDSPLLSGSRWDVNAIPAGGCVQVWSIGRAAPKAIDGCSEISAWFSTTDAGVYVWTQTAGVESFTLQQNGEWVVTCPAAPPNSQDNPLGCDVYLPPVPAPDQSRFIYVSYTQDVLLIRNPSVNVWMPLTRPLTTQDGTVINLSDAARYDNTLAIALTPDGERLPSLAPNECIVFSTVEKPDAPLPEPCGLIVAEQQLDTPFWLADFVITDNNGLQRSCLGASADKIMICVVQQ